MRPCSGGDAENAEIFLGNVDALHLLRSIACAEIQAGAREIVKGHGVESLVVGLPCHELRNGGLSPDVAGLVNALDSHNAVGLRIGEGLEQDRVHHRENGRVRADAERQSGDGDNAESGGLDQQANGVAEIGCEAAHMGLYGGARAEVRGN